MGHKVPLAPLEARRHLENLALQMGRFRIMVIQTRFHTLSMPTKGQAGRLEVEEVAQMHLLLGRQLLMALMLAGILLAQTATETARSMEAMAAVLLSGATAELVQMPHPPLGQAMEVTEQMRLHLEQKPGLETAEMAETAAEEEAATGVERTLRLVIH